MDFSSISLLQVMAPLLLAALVLLLSLFGLSLLQPSYDSLEPPVIPQKIPFVGHIFGLIRHGARYFDRISQKHNLPIFTLQTATKRTYVVNAPDLVVAVQKQTKTILFSPFVVIMMPRLFGTSDRSNAIVGKDATKEKDAYMADMHDEMYAVLAPGDELERMTKVTVEMLGSFYDELASGGDQTIDFFAWARRVFTISSAESVYGSENPFRHHPDMEEWFWTFEAWMTPMMIGVFPTITARAGVQARENFTNVMEAYLGKTGGHAGGDLLKVRYDLNKRYDIPLRDTATYEIGNCIGIMINATPTFFWLLFDIYSRPDLLQAIRDELESSGTLSLPPTNTNSDKPPTLNIPSLRTSCPLLFSTFQETLRVRTRNATSRVVVQDTTITNSSGNRYLLKKDSILQMPAMPMHYNTSLWGTDAAVYNPHRFIKSSSNGTTDQATTMRKFKTGAFRAFGGGATLCPGRHFATNELLAATAMFVSRFEMEPTNTTSTGRIDGGEGKWVEPKMAGNRLASSIPVPEEELRVQIKLTKVEGLWLDFETREKKGQGGTRLELAI